MSEIGTRLKSVLKRLDEASAKRPADQQYFQSRLVAVSKTKPVEHIIEAYDAGQRIFGENYVNELVEKAADSKLRERCPQLRWHFIGRLQRNKVARLARLPSLAMVETVDSERLADTLNLVRQAATLHPLSVMVQVNTSHEQNKGGVEECAAAALVRHIRLRCPALLCAGLMTIGAYSHSAADAPNPDFERLLQCRLQVCSELELQPSQLELSMGMSADFEQAILVGSSNVRVGSEIFGTRAGAKTAPDSAPPAPGGGAEAPSAGAEAPGGDAEAPSAGDKAPSAGAEAPSGGDEAHSGGDKAPSTGDEAPSTGDEAPSADAEAPSTGDKAPSADAEAPSTGDEAPSTGDEASTDATRLMQRMAAAQIN